MIQKNKRFSSGFTIVELLIVIVVIAILAAISVVAFGGIQERARNSQRLSDASSVIKLIQSYKAANDALPFTTNGNAQCPATFTTGCYYTKGAASTTTNAVETAVAPLGTPPKIDSAAMSVNLSGTAAVVGPIYQYRAGVSLDGTTQSMAVVIYWLEGGNRNCSPASGKLIVSTTAGSYSPPYVTSTNPYTYGNLNGNTATACMVAIF